MAPRDHRAWRSTPRPRAEPSTRRSPAATGRAGLVAAALGLCAGVLGGCASYSERTDSARRALDAGERELALREFNAVLGVRSSDRVPDDLKKDGALALLERGTVLQALADYPRASRDMGVADKELELLDIAGDAAGAIGKWVFSDSATKYRTSPIEKLSLNAINLINYLAQGDLEGAAVEARRFDTMRRYMHDNFPSTPAGTLGSYLAGFVFERRGDADRALHYYDDALRDRPFASLDASIRRLSAGASYRSPRLDAIVADAAPSSALAADNSDPQGAAQVNGADGVTVASAPPSAGELLLIVKVGRVPHRYAKRIPIGLAVGLGATFITGDTTILEHSAFKVVVYPELADATNTFNEAEVLVDGQGVTLELAGVLGDEIRREYDALRPKIIGAAITRLIVRAAAAEGARAAGKQAGNGAGGIIGFLAAAAVEGALVAADRPDTRSWTTLPDRVYVARRTLPAGHHSVRVELRGPQGREQRSFEVDLAPGGFAALDVTPLR